MLPVVLQQLITIGINLLDNIMIGGLGEETIAAASFGNQFFALFQFVCMGLGSGSIVMSSQFWGRGEIEPLRETAALALKVTILCCAAFSAVAVAFPAFILRLFTDDINVIIAGKPYLRLVGLTYIISGVSSTCTYLIRSVGSVRVPLISSVFAFFVNLFFNWVFIFGKLGAPALGIVGAALGTIIARTAEFIIIFGFFIFKEDRFAFRFRHFALSGKRISAQYIHYSMPVLISDTLLGLSLSVTTGIVGHMSADISAANAIVNTMIQCLSVLNMGMAGASAIAIGNSIGEGNLQKAKAEGNCYILLSMLFGAFLILILWLLEAPYFSLYSIKAETLSIAHSMVLVNAIFLPVQCMAYVTSKGVLRGGGDTRFLLLADSSLIWLLSIPLGALAGLVWHLSAFWVYFFLRLEYPLKGIVCLIRYCTGKWIKVIRVNSN